MLRKVTMTISVATVLLALGGAAQAALLLDFGPNITNVPGQSPGHEDGGVTGTTWNKVQVDDVSSLSYDDGSAATGVAVDLGSGTAINAVDFAANPTRSSALGNWFNDGLYDGSVAAKDGIFDVADGPIEVLAVQITGLAAGRYEVYLTAANTNAGTFINQEMLMYAASATGAGTYDFSNAASASFTNEYDATATQWTPGQQYNVIEVTVGEGEALYVAGMTGENNEEGGRAFLNSLEIVAVPEPGTLALLGFGGLAAALRRRRRHG